MPDSNRLLRLLLRFLGTIALGGLLAVLLPYSWMNSIHHALGLGELPSQPIVGYLARSTSAFYGALGGLLWVLSGDVARHRLVLGYVGWAMVGFGVMLLGVDWVEGLPLYWRVVEPMVVAFYGTLILVLRRGVAGPPELPR